MRLWEPRGSLLVVVGGTGGVFGAEGGTPTYHREVVRILQKNCQDCHRPARIGAPFARLLTYEQARKRASDLARVASSRAMPPWPASIRGGGHPFRDHRACFRTEEIPPPLAARAVGEALRKATPKRRAPPRRWPSEWPLGAPDLVLSMPEPYTLGGEGEDDFRAFVIPTGLAVEEVGLGHRLQAGEPEGGPPRHRGLRHQEARADPRQGRPEAGLSGFRRVASFVSGQSAARKAVSPGKAPRYSHPREWPVPPAGFRHPLAGPLSQEAGKPEDADASALGLATSRRRPSTRNCEAGPSRLPVEGFLGDPSPPDPRQEKEPGDRPGPSTSTKTCT